MNGDTPESARLLVVESEIRRHDVWLEDHDKRILASEKNNDVTVRLEALIKTEVLPALKALNECKIAEEAIARAKTSFWDGPTGKFVWDIARMAVVAFITWIVTVNQVLVGK